MISHQHLSGSLQGPSGRQNLTVPGTALALVPAHLDRVSFAKLAQLESSRVSYFGTCSECNCVIEAKKPLVGRGLWEVYVSLHVRMSMST